MSRPQDSFWTQANFQNSPNLLYKVQNDHKNKKMKNRKQKILQKESHQSIQVNSKKLPNPNPKNDQTWATKVQHAPQKKRKHRKIASKLR